MGMKIRLPKIDRKLLRSCVRIKRKRAWPPAGQGGGGGGRGVMPESCAEGSDLRSIRSRLTDSVTHTRPGNGSRICGRAGGGEHHAMHNEREELGLIVRASSTEMCDHVAVNL